MASVSYWQTHYWRLIATGKVRLGVDPFKIALLTSAYARNAAHAQWSDISGFEVAAGNGYTAGGQSLVLAVNGITDDAIIYIDPVWTALTKTFRWAAVVCDINVDALVKPLIGIVLLDSTPADIVNNGSNYTLDVPGLGLFQRYQPA